MKKENKLTLTRAELEVMEILWKSGKALDVHEMVENYPEPHPAYTTISTVVRLLTMKGFVGFKKGNGKQHLYFPQISKAEYISKSVSDVKANFFGGSVSSFVSFFLQEEKLSKEELEEIATLALSLSHSVPIK
jgi:predicted transcriptional regulator